MLSVTPSSVQTWTFDVTGPIGYTSPLHFDLELGCVGFVPGSNFTIQATVTALSGLSTIDLDYQMFLMHEAPDTTHCFATDQSPSGQSVGSAPSWTFIMSYSGGYWGSVGGLIATGTGCTDYTRFHLDFGAFQTATSITVHFVLTATPNPSTICAYGTEKALPAAAVEVGIGLLDELGLIKGVGLWAVPIILAQQVTPLLLNELCSGPPLPDQTISDADWTTPNPNGPGSVAAAKVIAKFQSHAWNFFCQCAPAPTGNPPPVSPPVINWIQPTSYVTYQNITIDNTQLSTVINQIFRFQIGNQITNIGTNQITQAIQQCACVSGYVLDAAHAGLTGEGSFAVADLVGMLVQITTDPGSAHDMVGNPPYLFNRGWLAITDAHGFLAERRLTREAQIWLPAEMPLATAFTWWLPPGLTMTATELKVAPP